MAEDTDFDDIIRGALATRPILLLGELHDEPDTRHIIAAHLPTARAAGAQHLCLEMPVSMQPVFDGFARGDISKQGLEDFLRRSRAKEPEALADLIAAAKENGLQCHAVDYRFQSGGMNIRADPLFQEAMRHETQAVKDEVDAYYRLGDDVVTDRDLADQLSAKRIQEVTNGEKSLVLYGDSHLFNLNNAELMLMDTELSQNLPESDYTYVRMVASRPSAQRVIDYAKALDTAEEKASNPYLGCTENSRRADFVYLTGEQQGYKTFDADNHDRGAGISLPLWGSEQPCQLGVWQEVMEGLKHMVGLSQGESPADSPHGGAPLPNMSRPRGDDQQR